MWDGSPNWFARLAGRIGEHGLIRYHPAPMNSVLVTGSSGLIGSEAVAYFDQRGWKVIGVDNNMRADFFGPKGDTTWNLNRLRSQTKNFVSTNADIRDRAAMKKLIEETRPHLIVHAAAQPSHDL